MKSTVWVYTMSRAGEVGAWSRYKFPFGVDAFCQKGDHLYIRSGDDVLMVDEKSLTDYAGHGTKETDFTSTVQWPWLDFGQPGTSKMMVGLDVSTQDQAPVEVAIMTDQSNRTRGTTPFTINADTMPGRITPMPVMAPSFSVKLVISSLADWKLQAVTLYVNDQRVTA